MSPAKETLAPTLFLLVEDEGLVAAACERALAPFGSVYVTASVGEAGLWLASARLAGLVTDIALPDGNGIDLARDARARSPSLPILLISGSVDALRLDAADVIGASYLLKPIEAHQLTRFAERATARQRRSIGLLRTWADRYGLTAAEEMTLRLAIDGLRRDEISARRGVEPGTVKSQIHSILSKVERPTLADAVTTFFRELASPVEAP